MNRWSGMVTGGVGTGQALVSEKLNEIVKQIKSNAPGQETQYQQGSVTGLSHFPQVNISLDSTSGVEMLMPSTPGLDTETTGKNVVLTGVVSIVEL